MQRKDRLTGSATFGLAALLILFLQGCTNHCHFFERTGYEGKRFDVVEGPAGQGYNTLHSKSIRWSTGDGKPGDEISSVSCDQGVAMFVYKDSQWGGEFLKVEGKIPNLHSIGWGDTISSISNGPGAACCTVYRDKNFEALLGNTCLSHGAGDWNSLGAVGWATRSPALSASAAVASWLASTRNGKASARSCSATFLTSICLSGATSAT